MTTTALTLSHQNWLTPSTDIDQYIAKVRQIPALDADEERRLAIALQETNDINAAQTLIVHHLKFVVHIARGFTGYGLPLGDLIQEGNIGLMKAVKRFEPQRGVRLVSFAVHWIKSEIHEYVIRNWRMVKIATTKAQRKLFFNLRSMKKNIGWLNEEEARVIADELNVSTKDVFEMESRIHGQDIAFELGDDDEDNDHFSPSQWLADSSVDPAESAENAEHDNLMQRKLAKGLQALDARSRAIVQARWLNEDNKATLQTLADQYNVSAERIRQIEQQAMHQLRSHIEA
ncbi:RNA polymerase sigma factor RpoH [uncultured Cardiobacterium sp.]|uniref:RNA polymerase sigma factor RpoH n=1 Tax=uncultured Cardiobacterium sp. TaxID=417619 RepID=UPI002622BBE8|nr:RNA polymerase sigma factor RpoH [uncultured Cardiobacterium sp.]